MGNLRKPATPIPSNATSVAVTTRSDISLGGLLDRAQIVVGPSSNGFGIRTVSAVAPANTQGLDGDIWYQV